MAISTSSWISCPVGVKKTDPIRQIATVPGAIHGQYLVVNNHETAGACLQWLRDREFPPRTNAQNQGKPDHTRVESDPGPWDSRG